MYATFDLAEALGGDRDNRYYDGEISAEEEEGKTHDEASGRSQLSDSDRKQAILERLRDAERICRPCL